MKANFDWPKPYVDFNGSFEKSTRRLIIPNLALRTAVR